MPPPLLGQRLKVFHAIDLTVRECGINITIKNELMGDRTDKIAILGLTWG